MCILEQNRPIYPGQLFTSQRLMKIEESITLTLDPNKP